MKIESIESIYFSPTGTTRQIVSHIARGMGTGAVADLDLTLERPASIELRADIAVIGAPVYAGRVPLVVTRRLEKVTAKGMPAVVVVLYGNRAYGDALLELIDLTGSCGFHPIAAGAFIGEHSYATETYPIAMGRPDPHDLSVAENFGVSVAKKMSEVPHPATLDVPWVPGDSPYKNRPPALGQAPITQADLCTLCGTCAAVCPTQVIEVTETVTTVPNDCIACCACIKSCPTQARIYTASGITRKARWLYENFSQRKSPEIFI